MVIVKRCVCCRSTRISIDAGILTGSYHCPRCGYEGPIIIEEEVNAKKH